MRERVRARVPEAELYERTLAQIREERDRSESGQVVVRGREVAWETEERCRLRPYLRAGRGLQASTATVLDDWNLYAIELAGRSGVQRVFGGLVLSVTTGSGYTLAGGERFAWEAGDLLVIPSLASGVDVEHVGGSAEQPVRLIAFANQALDGWSAAGSLPLERGTPTGRASEPRRHRDRPPEEQSFLERLRVYTTAERERAEHGKVVVSGSERPWGQNRQAFIKRYLWTSWAIGVPSETPSDDWRVFVQNIRVHSGKHKHQGGLVIYVIEGEGYTVVEGEKHEWEAGDLLLLPLKPGGVEHQHFNKYDDKPAKWIAFINSAVHQWGASDMVQVAEHPEYRRSQADGRSDRQDAR